MSSPIRVLYVDDYPLDRELVRHALEIEHEGFQLVEAQSRADFEARLAEGRYDLVLSDFNILGFEGLQVLAAVHARAPRTPVVIVTGTGSEEIAVEAMKRGATDYVIKTPHHIQRLPHTIYAALERKRLEEQRARVEQERDRLFNYSLDLLCVAGFDGYFKQLNPAWETTLGWTKAELLASPYLDFVHPADQAATTQAAQRLQAGQSIVSFENRYRDQDGAYHWLAWNAYPLADEALIFSVARDITERKQAEARIDRQLHRLAALRDIDRAITGSVDLRVILNILLEQAITQLQVDAADILLFEPQTLMLNFAAGRGFHSEAVQHARLRLGEGYAGRAVLERRVIQVPNVIESGGGLASALIMAHEAFIGYVGAPLIAKGQVKGALEIFHRTPLDPGPEWLDFLAMLAEQAAIAIDSAQLFDSLQRSNVELALAYDATIEGWSRALDLRDKETEGHTQRVVDMSVQLARRIGMSDTDLTHVRRGALLHDIGKMGVPDSILLKPGPLTADEWATMQKHPQYAFDMLSPIVYLHPALEIAYCHHEKWDGTGYPRRLKGEQIPPTARIFAIADVWDALCSDRPYRSAWPRVKVLDYIKTQTGKHFDPQVVEIFMNWIAEVNADELPRPLSPGGV